MDMLQRAAGKAALAGADDVHVLGMHVARGLHRGFAEIAGAGGLVVAHPVEPDHPARFFRAERQHGVEEMLARIAQQEQVGEQREVFAPERQSISPSAIKRGMPRPNMVLRTVGDLRLGVGPDGLGAVNAVEAEVRGIAERVVAAEAACTCGARMDEAQVVVLLEIVVSQLPVGVDLVAIFLIGRRAGKRHLFEHSAISPRYSGRLSCGSKLMKISPAQTLTATGFSAASPPCGMEALEIGRGDQRPVTAESPHVVRAGEGVLLAAGLFGQLGAAVGAGVVEGADLAVLAAHDQDRGLGEFQFAANEAARLGQFADVADFSQLRIHTALRSSSYHSAS